MCWQRVLGRPPSWGEKLTDAHHRYARRFLTHLGRGRRTGKNMILVSHGIMVQTCLKVLPGTSALSVASIPFCGGLMAGLRRISKGSPQLASNDSLTCDSANSPCQEIVGDWPEGNSEKRRPASQHLQRAQLHGWDVQPFQVVFDVAEDTPAATAKRGLDLLARLKAGSFSWAQLKLLLGQLPTELPLQAFQTPELGDSTQLSMEILSCPSHGWKRQVSPEQPEQNAVDCKVPQLNLNGSRLMERRRSQ